MLAEFEKASTQINCSYGAFIFTDRASVDVLLWCLFVQPFHFGGAFGVRAGAGPQ